MFQIYWYVWLQVFFDVVWMVLLMIFVSMLGYEWVYVLLIVVFSFGVWLCVGLGVMFVVLFMFMVIYVIKQSVVLFCFSDVDIYVLDKGCFGYVLVDDGVVGLFWLLFSGEVIVVLCVQFDLDYGFISGYVGVVMVVMMVLVLCFGICSWGWWIVLLIGWLLLMVLLWMYLGWYFLFDVLGGWLVGMVLVWFVWQCLFLFVYYN